MMHTTKKKAHGRDPAGFQIDTTNDLDSPTGQRQGKAFATLAARFALAGHTLTRSDPADGAVTYYAGRWGWLKAFPDLEAAERFIVKIEAGKAVLEDERACLHDEDEQHG